MFLVDFTSMSEGERNSTLYFGRIHFLNKSTDEDVDFKELLFSFLSQGKHLGIDDDEYDWVFGDTEKISDDAIYGILGKVRKNQVASVFDDNTKKFITKDLVKNIAVDLSNFWVFTKKHIIVFERRQHIGEIQFQELLTKGFSSHTGKEFAIEIDLLKDKTQIERIMKEADKFTCFELNVTPTNPDPNPDSDKIDNELKSMRAKKGKFTFSNVNEGLDFTGKDNLINSGIALCNLGYGTYKGEYVLGNNKRSINSKKQVIKRETKLPSDSKEKYSKILTILQKILEGLKDE
jgi:hypothetical protein